MKKEMKVLINRSIDYIFRHLNETLTVKDVADHFHFSEYYFARSFKEVTGNSVYAFIKRLKLDQSAIELKLKTDRSITEVGLDYGYSPSNYSSAFRKHRSVSPAEFRKSISAEKTENPFHRDRIEVFQTYAHYESKVRIEERQSCVIIYERTIGNYFDLAERWKRFIVDYEPYVTEETRMIERFYDDPSISSQTDSVCDLCITAAHDCPEENTATIKGGKFAVYRFEGEVSEIFCALQGLFSVWLPQSGYAMSERYGLNIYRNMDFNQAFVVMDFCIPVKQGRNSEVFE